MSNVLGTELTEIGLRIRNVRKKNGLTQKEFGNLIGKSLRTVQLYEKGQADMSIGMIFDIAKKLNVSPTDLLGYESPEVRIETLSDVLAILFKLYELQDLRYGVDVQRPPHFDGWQCSLVFDGKAEAEHNADLCLALESYRDELFEYENNRRSSERFHAWQDRMLAYYKNCTLK